MNLVLSMLVIAGGVSSVWAGITNPEGGFFAGLGRALRGEPAERKSSASSAAFLASVLGSSTGSATATATSSGTSSGKAGGSPRVIAQARKYLGRPYAWGGNGPSSFDCSGLTKRVYAEAAGVNLPRVSAAQALTGRPGTGKAGDLVAFGTPAHHVGISLGDGTMIHAPHPGAVVRVESIAGTSRSFKVNGAAYFRDVLSSKGAAT